MNIKIIVRLMLFEFVFLFQTESRGFNEINAYDNCKKDHRAGNAQNYLTDLGHDRYPMFLPYTITEILSFQIMSYIGIN